MLSYIDKIRQLLTGNKERRAISSNIYWLFTEQAIRFLLGFLVSIWVVRYLGPEDYGIFTYSLAFTGIISTFIGLGLGNIIIRELVKRPEKRDELLGLSLLLYFISAIVALIVCLAAIYFLRGTDHQTISLVSILVLGYLLKPFQVIGLYFESKVLGKLVVPFIIAGLVISNLLKIYFVIREGSLYAFAWITLVEGLISSMGMFYLYRKCNLSLKINWNKNIKLTKTLIKDGLPLMLSSFMIVIYMKVDQIMLREMVSAEEVGLYSVAVVLTSIWFFIPTIITRSFFPKMVASMQTDKILFEQQLQKLYNLIAMIGYVLCIPFSFLSDNIVLLLYGEAFSGAGGMLSVLIWTSFFMGFGVVRTSYVYAMNLGKTHLIITVIGAVVNVLLNFMLIPLYQGFGAVIATLAAQFFTCILSNFTFKELHKNGFMIIRAAIYPKTFY
jgi:O-antigen/teichoic acid export membrane protein